MSNESILIIGQLLNLVLLLSVAYFFGASYAFVILGWETMNLIRKYKGW